MKIDELLDKYFEGETSCEEERELRRFFTEEEVPEYPHSGSLSVSIAHSMLSAALPPDCSCFSG